MTFARRRINLKFQLGTGSFGGGGSDTLELTGLRCSATISKPGGQSLSELELRVYGMTLDQMNKLTILGKPVMQARRNIVVVSAGDDDSGVAVCFAGVITEAWADLAGAPDGVFSIRAYTGYLAAMKPVPPTSYNGSVDVATVMAGIAAQWPREAVSGNGQAFTGIPFENSGVSIQLASPYFPGTLRDQALACQRAGGFNMHIDDSVLAIWPKGGTRGGQIPVIAADTGMVGYPARTDQGIALTTLFNPSLVFGSTVQVKSTLIPAAGKWNIFSVTHDIEAEMPGGKWFTHVECSLFGRPLGVAS